MLSNYKILDLTRLLPGDFCTQILADLGMQVLKVEDTFGGDYIRYVPPLAPDGESTFYLALNRNKKSMRLNLKTEPGKKIFSQLVKEYDCVIDSFRPDVLTGLGFPFSELKKINPKIIYCTITGYGYESSKKLKAGHDLNYISLAGVLSLNQPNENLDLNSIFPVQIADISGALFAAIGILSCLLANQNGNGQAFFLDVPMFATAMSFIAHYLSRYSLEKIQITKNKQELAGFLPSYSIYKTRDNKFISLAALEPKFWDKFCEKINRLDLKVMGLSFTDAEKVKVELNQIFSQKKQKEWEVEFKDDDFCCEPIRSLGEVCSDNEYLKDELIICLKNNQHNGVLTVNLPFKINNQRPKLKFYPPKIGEQTEEILKKLNYTEVEINKLKGKGVI